MTEIGESAFEDCANLTSVTIPDGVTSIGEDAFLLCTSLTSLTIPASVTAIGDYAFFFCTGLTSVTIPDSVTVIGEWVFIGCISLTGIYVDDLNTSFESIDGVLFNQSGSTLLTFPGEKAGSYTIPAGVTAIGGGAFIGCTALTSVTIPDSITAIGEGAFIGCTSLTSVTIPASVTAIGASAFSGCTSLTSVTIPASVVLISEYAFEDCTSLTSVYFDGAEPGGCTNAFINVTATFYYKAGYTFSAPSIGTITCTKANTYSVTVNSGVNDTVTPSTTEGIPGETVTLKAMPNPGFSLDSLTCSSDNATINDNYYFTMPDSAATVDASWTVNKYSVDVSGLNGISVVSGTTGSDAASAAEDYTIYLTGDFQKSLPDTVTVTIGGVPAAQGAAYD